VFNFKAGKILMRGPSISLHPPLHLGPCVRLFLPRGAHAAHGATRASSALSQALSEAGRPPVGTAPQHLQPDSTWTER
jgi:hypothetical protein